jgi:hypothetical protein
MYDPIPVSPLSTICPMQRFALLDDGFGNLCIVSAAAWVAAHYHAHH